MNFGEQQIFARKWSSVGSLARSLICEPVFGNYKQLSGQEEVSEGRGVLCQLIHIM